MPTQNDPIHTAPSTSPPFLREYVLHTLRDMVVSRVEYDNLRGVVTLEVAMTCADGKVTLLALALGDEQLPFFNRAIPTRATVLQAVVDATLPELAKVRMKDTG